MSRKISRAENWERAYSALENVNLAAFDYAAIKQSLLDYMKLYHSEVFNDFIESSELIAVIEAFAYVGELLAYRYDVTARENLLSTAELRSSILRLAKLISYNASRPIPARGLAKITSITTTQSILDPSGLNLANKTVKWSDPTNPNWKTQFISILQLVMKDKFGTVSPANRFQLVDELFEIYQLEHNQMTAPVIPLSATVDGRGTQMEVVPVGYDEDIGLVEVRPTHHNRMSVLYGSDGLGDSSNTTGFFMYVKQGKLQRVRVNFDGVTPNQTFSVNIANINDTDVWLNQVNPTTNQVIDDADIINRIPYDGKSGEWIQVDTASSQNVIFNTNPYRNKYEVQTIENNGVRLNFGDGNFSDIPHGIFDIWFRTSEDADIIVPQSSINNRQIQIPYTDQYGITQTLTLTISLINSLQNSSASETNEHIKVAAPALYYSQDRMVNGEDYNNFPLRDPSILKLRTFNRTFIGDSRYVTWHDPSGSYENLHKFGANGMLYFEPNHVTTSYTYVNDEDIINTMIIPLMGSIETFTLLTNAGVHASLMRRSLTSEETMELLVSLAAPPIDVVVKMYYDTFEHRWCSIRQGDEDTLPATAMKQSAFVIERLTSRGQVFIERTGTSLVLKSPVDTFIAESNDGRVIDYNTLNSLTDNIKILKANLNSNKDSVLSQDWKLVVLGQVYHQSGSNMGLPDNTALRVIPQVNGFPQVTDPFNPNTDYPVIANVMCPKLKVVKNGDEVINFPIPVIDESDIMVELANEGGFIDRVEFVKDDNGVILGIKIVDDPENPDNNILDGTELLVKLNEYVYFQRNEIQGDWVPIYGTPYDAAVIYLQNAQYSPTLYRRCIGTSELNFSWTHVAPYYHLIDPSPSNINDVYIITKGYFTEFKRWLNTNSTIMPLTPSAFHLRSTYEYLFKSKMISDTVILHPGKFKLIFGSRADINVQGRFKVIKAPNSTLSDNQIKNTIVTTTKNYFDVTKWEFGETFYFDELSTVIGQALANDVLSVVFVPNSSEQTFGDGYQIRCKEDEVIFADIDNSIIDIVSEYSPKELNQKFF